MYCDMCKQERDDAEMQPSRSQLIFGGFPVQLESRCGKCEKEVYKANMAIIKNMERKQNKNVFLEGNS